jgi:hypothetical protein
MSKGAPWRMVTRSAPPARCSRPSSFIQCAVTA